MGKKRIEFHLNKKERQLIKLLIKLLQKINKNNNANLNYSNDEIPLSDLETVLLIKLLTDYNETKETIQRAYFIRNILNSNEDNQNLREIYLTIREKYGRPRMVPAVRWAEYRKRLGLSSHNPTKRKIRTMPRDHFLQLEEKLFMNLDFPPEIINNLMYYITEEWHKFESFRKRDNSLFNKKNKTIILSILDKIQVSNEPIKEPFLSKINLSSLVTLIANGSVMFTTRDWSITGTISQIISESMNLIKS